MNLGVGGEDDTTNLTEVAFSRYSGDLRYSSYLWVNNSNNYPSSEGYESNGICGTIASAAMLVAWYDDYVDNTMVPDSIRTRNSTSPGNLIKTLYKYIDAPDHFFINGTIPGDLLFGIQNYFSSISLPHYTTLVHSSSFTTRSKVKSRINAGRPIAVGLLGIKGSAYNDHWVLVYKYIDNSSGSDYYKAVDNHGSYTAVINVSWTQGYVYIDK